MARMMREFVVCDVCGSDQNVATVTVALNGEQHQTTGTTSLMPSRNVENMLHFRDERRPAFPHPCSR
jgi:hypothetical protein